MEPESLNSSGLTVMLLSVGSVVLLLGFCLYKVLTLPPVPDDDPEE